MPKSLEDLIAGHYGLGGLAAKIMDAIGAAGIDPDALTPEALAPVDEFHTAGRKTTQMALDMTPLTGDMHVLDAGCGIGGTARYLANEIGCRVTGIDLTPEYVDVARLLTDLTKLTERCTYHLGSATEMPFSDACFDAGVSFHVAMNIEDRVAFYAELARVLRPGAPLCLFDVMKGPSPGMVFPVPWAETEETSFLKSRDETVNTLRAAGFSVEAEKSLRRFAIDYFRKVFADTARADGPPPLGLHLLTGSNAKEKFVNYSQALDAEQIDPVIVVATRD